MSPPLGRICDVVFDTLGGEVQVRSYDVLKAGGKHIGATVITTASGRNHDYVKKLGADCAAAALRGVDCIGGRIGPVV